ncbi:F-box domain containing protein, partial [Tanacetum coccineum]
AKGNQRDSDPSIEEDCPRPDVMDFISKMPDDVLVNILSRLPLKQAVITGVLSPRWRFAFDKKAEVLTLDFYEISLKVGGCDTEQYYDFPLPLSDGSMVHLSECPSSSSMVVETLPFKELNLLCVNVSDVTLKLLLKNSPHLETLYIFGGGLLTDVNFHFNGLDAEILPKLKEVDIGLEDIEVEAIPELLPNIKTLKLTLPTEEDDSLMDFIEIAKKCPKLETFVVSLHWSAPINGKTPWPALGHSFPHLKHLEIVGYRGIVSDYQIVLYMIGNAAGTLKKIVIDPSIHPYDACFLTANASLKI